MREDRFDRECVAVEGNGAGFEAGQVEELGHQATEPLHLGEHGREGAGIGRRHAVDQILEGGLQRGERCA